MGPLRAVLSAPPQQSVSHICRPTFGELAFLCHDAIKENNMALTITATVSKKVGKPNYGSEGFTLTVQSEVSNMDQVQEESHRLYLLLNDSVNQELSGSTTEPAPKNGEWPKLIPSTTTTPTSRAWRASDKQRDLILKIIDENEVDRGDVESLSLEMFSNSNLQELNRLQASGLIDELLQRYGKKSTRGTTPSGRFNGRTTR